MFGQDLKNTSYTTSTGEKVLRIEFILPIAKKEAWNLFTTAEGWKKWAVPVASVDFRTGGVIMTHYDRDKSIGDPGTIRLPITNYIEGELISLKVILNETFSEEVRRQDKDLQEIIQFFEIGNNKTKIVSSMIGWGQGAAWDNTYAFFAKGNEWTYRELTKLVH